MRIQVLAAAVASAAVASATTASGADLQVAYVGDASMTCGQIASAIAQMDVIAITHGRAQATAEVTASPKPKKPTAEDDAAADRIETVHMRRLFLTGLFQGRCAPIPPPMPTAAGAAIIDPPAGPTNGR
jgi:hypothetical protein